ncbi:AMIN domain-containing protein [Calothrix rhizosoleniae]|uniref:AMIN domain-containing protein n=1 Tax=Calothrix rhizosoleniae TaxID=888997 RepID=UPI001F3E98FC|nr:AMIN domain-containing protein [Calothrix rhizosoleniae]
MFGFACTSTVVLTQLSIISGLFAASPRARLDDWRFSPQTLQLEFTLSGSTQPRHFSLRQPDRIVVDLPNTKLGYVNTKQNFSGAVQSIRISQLNADVTRIVLDLAPGTVLDANQVQLQPISWQNPSRWLLTPINNLAYANYSQTNNIPGNFNNNQQAPLFPQLPGNNNIPGNFNNNQQAPLFPQLPGNNTIPSNFNNDTTTNNFSVPINTQIQPRVIVPPLNSSNKPQPLNSNSVLPPATFNNQPSFVRNTTPAPQTNFPVPNLPNYQQNNSNFQVLPYGQPIPQPGQ